MIWDAGQEEINSIELILPRAQSSSIESIPRSPRVLVHDEVG
jgi:hypothetical protein